MAGRHDFQQRGFATGHQGFGIAFEDGLEWLLLLPFGMRRGQSLNPIESKNELYIERLFGPQSAIVIEGGDSLSRWYEVRPARCG